MALTPHGGPASAMIGEIDTQVRGWIREAVHGAEVWLGPPLPGENRTGVGLHLLRILPEPSPRGARPPPLRIRLEYLVSTWAEAPSTEHRLLAEVVVAALSRDDVQVAPEPVSVSLWAAFGVPPRPGLLVVASLRVERSAKPAPLVREPPIVRWVASGALAGVVVGPGDVPVANARIELPALDLRVATDADGRFRFPRVPATAGETRLRVVARGRTQDVTRELPAGGAPLTIRFDLEEGDHA